MTDRLPDRTAEVAAALRAIVSDPDHGPAMLSEPAVIANLLKDLLPDTPIENSVIIAAAQARLADTLMELAAQGMDAATTVNIAGSRFAAASAFSREACDWVAGQFALALGIDVPLPARFPAGRGASEVVGHASTIASSAPPPTVKITERLISTSASSSGERDQRTPGDDHLGTLLSEVIMLRVRVGTLHWMDQAAGAITERLVTDIDRARTLAGDSELSRHLAEAVTIAEKLLRALRSGGSYSEGRLRRRVIHDSDACEELWRKFEQIPIDVSGLDVRSIVLPKPSPSSLNPGVADWYAVQGVVWTDETIWPYEYEKEVILHSRLLRKGVYQVVTASRAR